MWKVAVRHIRRLAIAIVGFTLLIVGVAMLVTPGPGWLLIFAGLGTLGAEFVWARHVTRKLRKISKKSLSNLPDPAKRLVNGMVKAISILRARVRLSLP
jgi:uncharacterized protein (TIGR02611 family)